MAYKQKILTTFCYIYLNKTLNDMKKAIKILMERDDITKEAATQLVEECISEIEETGYDPVEAEYIMMEKLGLEPDYLMDIFGF